MLIQTIKGVFVRHIQMKAEIKKQIKTGYQSVNKDFIYKEG